MASRQSVVVVALLATISLSVVAATSEGVRAVDWAAHVVTGSEVYTDVEIRLSGPLVIAPGGTLDLRRVELTLVLGALGPPVINVSPGGTLLLEDVNLRAATPYEFAIHGAVRAVRAEIAAPAEGILIESGSFDAAGLTLAGDAKRGFVLRSGGLDLADAQLGAGSTSVIATQYIVPPTSFDRAATPPSTLRLSNVTIYARGHGVHAEAPIVADWNGVRILGGREYAAFLHRSTGSLQDVEIDAGPEGTGLGILLSGDDPIELRDLRVSNATTGINILGAEFTLHGCNVVSPDPARKLAIQVQAGIEMRLVAADRSEGITSYPARGTITGCKTNGAVALAEADLAVDGLDLGLLYLGTETPQDPAVAIHTLKLTAKALTTTGVVLAGPIDADVAQTAILRAQAEDGTPVSGTGTIFDAAGERVGTFSIGPDGRGLAILPSVRLGADPSWQTYSFRFQERASAEGSPEQTMRVSITVPNEQETPGLNAIVLILVLAIALIRNGIMARSASGK